MIRMKYWWKLSSSVVVVSVPVSIRITVNNVKMKGNKNKMCNEIRNIIIILNIQGQAGSAYGTQMSEWMNEWRCRLGWNGNWLAFPWCSFLRYFSLALSLSFALLSTANWPGYGATILSPRDFLDERERSNYFTFKLNESTNVLEYKKNSKKHTVKCYSLAIEYRAHFSRRFFMPSKNEEKKNQWNENGWHIKC